MKKLLVVVDMQNDFTFGSLGSEEARAALPEAVALTRTFIEEGSAVAFTLDTHGDDYLSTQEGKLLPVSHCKKGTEGWEVASALAPFLKNARTFEKGTFGSVALAEFVKKEGFDEVLLCGVCTDICVVSNALLLKAYCPEARIKVIKRACADTTAENHLAALKTMLSCQIIVE